MWFQSWLPKRQWSDPGARRRSRRFPVKRAVFRPTLEALENRIVPSTLVVTNNLDTGVAGDGSLRGEITAAHSGDTIKFAGRLAGQTITLNSALVLNKNLDIEGLGAAKLTVSGNHASRVFDIQGGATVTLAGLTIANGNVVDAGGGGIANEAGSTLYLINDALANNTAYGIGGGLWNDIGATVSVSNTTFTGNKAFGSLTFSYPEEGFAPGSGSTEGGAIDNDGTANVSNSTFSNNLSQGITGSDGTGGGAKGGAIATDGRLTISGSTFTDNRAQAGDGGAGGPGASGGHGGQSEGGAIAMFIAGNQVSITSSTFNNNHSLGGTGGIGSTGHNGGTGGVGAGGALSLSDATLTLSHSTFTSNEAVGGVGGVGGKNGNGGAGGIGRGGAYVHSVTFGTSTPLSNLEDVTMQNNKATGGSGGTGGVGGNGGTGGAGQGGAIRALLGTLNISDSHLDDNQAVGGIGGAAGAGGSHGGNGGNGQGGALLTTFGITATLTNTDLLSNQATGGVGAAGGNGGNGLGGAIFNDGSSPFGTPSLTLFGCTVMFNEADGGAGGVGGSDGAGIGGGVYNLGLFAHDDLTTIAQNLASTSNNDIFTT